MGRQTLSSKLEASRKLIFNSRDAQITSLLAAIGVDDDYLTEGETLYTETMVHVDKQSKEYQEQSKAYDEYYVQRDEVQADHDRTFKLVDILSRKDTDLQNRLKLDQTLPLGIEEWISGASEQHNRLINEPDFLTRLERFKITPALLEAQKEAVINLRQLRNTANIEKGEAQEATSLRNDKLEELADYSRELKDLSKLALEGQNQLLEKLGITVKSN